MCVRADQQLADPPGEPQRNVVIIGASSHLQALFLPVDEMNRPVQQDLSVLAQRVILLPSLLVVSRSTSGEFVGGKVDDVDRGHRPGSFR